VAPVAPDRLFGAPSYFFQRVVQLSRELHQWHQIGCPVHYPIFPKSGATFQRVAQLFREWHQWHQTGCPVHCPIFPKEDENAIWHRQGHRHGCLVPSDRLSGATRARWNLTVRVTGQVVRCDSALYGDHAKISSKGPTALYACVAMNRPCG
jgi:hypothetical protein